LLEDSFHETEYLAKVVNWKKIRALHETGKKARELKAKSEWPKRAFPRFT